MHVFPGEFCENVDSELAGLAWGLRFCISHSQTVQMLPVPEYILNHNKAGKHYCAHSTGEDTEVQGLSNRCSFSHATKGFPWLDATVIAIGKAGKSDRLGSVDPRQREGRRGTYWSITEATQRREDI